MLFRSDIVSGLVATNLTQESEICVFLDIGTNGELVVGNREFLMAGAGAAGPALEGGVVKTGMRAVEGAVSYVRLEKGRFYLTVLGGGEPRGLCGSGIVDLIAQLYLNGIFPADICIWCGYWIRVSNKGMRLSSKWQNGESLVMYIINRYP